MFLKICCGVLLASWLLAGCGLKGPLYIPKDDEPEVRGQTAVRVTSPYRDPAERGSSFADEEGGYLPLLTVTTLRTD